MAEKAILYDATRCTACRGCQAACKQWNELEGEETVNTGSYENPPDLSLQTWVKMEFREVERGGKLAWLFTRRSCMHCTDAGCVKVCPSGALFHNELGFISYDPGLCTGCGYCRDFCPFDVPRLERQAITGAATMAKCTFCTTFQMDRIQEGLEPACVKTCPPDALIYGDRAELVAIGRERVQRLYDASGQRYGRLKGDVQREYDRRYSYTKKDLSGGNPGGEYNPDDGPIPFWGE